VCFLIDDGGVCVSGLGWVCLFFVCLFVCLFVWGGDMVLEEEEEEEEEERGLVKTPWN
jgi:hypothetical protein